MIGVISNSGDALIVAEFFELFKTPWEFHVDGRSYDVVIATSEPPARLDTKLLISYCSQPLAADSAAPLSTGDRQGATVIRCGHRMLPTYGDVLTFVPSEGEVLGSLEDGKTVALRFEAGERTTIRVGMDLFGEVRHLLVTGQSVEHAGTPTLDGHIETLRTWILKAGLPLIEIPPHPAGYPFVACLTHDIDFVGIRRHLLDHTMWGFLYRASVGSLRNLWRRRISVGQMLRSWQAAAMLPLVYLGWARDFWEPFDWYLKVERGLRATYFLIPFKHRPGDKVESAALARRGAAYDVTDIAAEIGRLREAGCEIGVHGIDAWHSIGKGRQERQRVAEAAGIPVFGIRMHWLLSDMSTPAQLEAAGFHYDATAGYNDTVGYRNGTGQVFRHVGTQNLLELPTQIQDGALFYGKRMDLSVSEAAERCNSMIARAREHGGVLTLIWHDRSHGPERFWGDFYRDLIARLKTAGAWFASAGDAVAWFRSRRAITFESTSATIRLARRLHWPGKGGDVHLPFLVRLHRPVTDDTMTEFVDLVWDGDEPLTLEPWVAPVRATAALGQQICFES